MTEPADEPPVPPLSPMRNPIRGYDWGSATTLAQLQGRTPTGDPEAELWMGGHPSSPSWLLPPAAADGPEGADDASAVPLPDVVTAAPRTVVGPAVLERFGARLPFMLKVLAIERPLSLQVHPDAARARAVYDPAGNSPYVDPYHKPELIAALEETEALFGFRRLAQSAALLSATGVPELVDLAEDLAAGARDERGQVEAIHRTFGRVVQWPLEEAGALVADAARAAERLSGSPDPVEATAGRWMTTLARLHPKDPLVIAPLLLDIVRLAPGDAVFVPAGVPHAYLSGCGVEVLAASDNVVRAGLTSKAIAVEELLEIIDCRPLDSNRTPAQRLGDHEIAWRPPVPDFQLTRLSVAPGTPVSADASVSGPQILLCTRGEVTLEAAGGELTLRAGRSAFATATAGPLTLTGDGDVFRAAPGV